MVFEHQGEHESRWAAIYSIASKIGCAAETHLCSDTPGPWVYRGDGQCYQSHVSS